MQNPSQIPDKSRRDGRKFKTSKKAFASSYFSFPLALHMFLLLLLVLLHLSSSWPYLCADKPSNFSWQSNTKAKDEYMKLNCLADGTSNKFKFKTDLALNFSLLVLAGWLVVVKLLSRIIFQSGPSINL